NCLFSGQVPSDITLLHKLVSLDLTSYGYDLKLRPLDFINLFHNVTNLEQLSLENHYDNRPFPWRHVGVFPSDMSMGKVLNCFHLASGLKINIAKSQVLGVGVSQNVVVQAANRIGCAVLNTPFRYLGVTVGDP
ncbi:hypothetical protein Tco_0095512, partial [Tanacetum coccineum]